MVEFPSQHSFVPFVIFRRLQSLSSAQHVGSTNQSVEGSGCEGAGQGRFWGIKAVQRCLYGVMLHAIVRSVIECLKRVFILPLHVINVEHCLNCQNHSMTTWHVPGSYEKWFAETKKSLKKTLPAAVIYSNKFATPSTPPRLGSFELSIRPYLSPTTQLVFSKLSSRTLPPVEDIQRELAVLLLPETITFSGSHILELHVYDSYHRVALVGATITLYKLNIRVTLETDIELCLPDNNQTKIVVDHEIDSNWTEQRKNRHKKRIEDAQRNAKVIHARAAVSSTSYAAQRKKLAAPKSFSSTLINSNSAESAALRHSAVFYKVRSWQKEDIAAWLRSFSLPKEVITRAFADGCVDGPSFLALANPKSFEKWGVRSKIKLHRMQLSLDQILAPQNEWTSTPAFDPFTNTLDLSGGAIPVSCEAARPKALFLKDDVAMQVIATKKTDSKGLALARVDLAGTYIIKIESPLTAVYSSNAFQISSPGHVALCALMKPKVGHAIILVKFDADGKKMDGISCLILSMVHIHSGRRHIVLVKSSTEEGIETNNDMEDRSPRQAVIKSSPPLNSTKRSASIGPHSSHAPNKPLVKRVSSIGAEMLSRMSSRSVVKEKSSPQVKPFERVTEEQSSPAAVQIMQAQIYLPVGKYYSEVDGGIFAIVEDKKNAELEQVHHWAHTDPITLSSEESSGTKLTYRGALALKCHNRVLLNSVRSFQKIYRRYKKDFIAKNLWAYLALKTAARRYIAYIRQSIRIKKAIRMQSVYRGWTQAKRYHYVLKCVIRIQSRIRGYLASKLVSLRRSKKDILIRSLRRYRFARLQYRNQAVIKIQCSLRQSRARKVLGRLLMKRRMHKRILRWLRWCRKSFLKKKEIAAEEKARLALNREEMYTRTYLKLKVIADREILKKKVAIVENHRKRQATRIQKVFRGKRVRQNLLIAIQGLSRLQVRIPPPLYCTSILNLRNRKYFGSAVSKRGLSRTKNLKWFHPFRCSVSTHNFLVLRNC
jgi:hypothetical protein